MSSRVSTPIVGLGQRTKDRGEEHRDASPRLLAAWSPVEQALHASVAGTTFNIWLAEVHPHSLVNGVWRVGCREQARGWLENRFGRLFKECAGRPVEFVVCDRGNE